MASRCDCRPNKMPSVTAMGMASSATLTRMRIVMAGGEKRRTKRASGAAELREELNERASSRVAGMSAVEHDLAIDGFCLVGIAGGGKGLRASKAFLEKRETSRSAVHSSQRYEAAPSGTGTFTCTCTGCLGRSTPGTRPVRARTAV